MNPTLLQHPSFDLTLPSDSKYFGQERTYSSLGGYSTNEPTYLHRRALNGLTNSTSPSSLAVSANNGLDFNTQPSFTDAPYHSHSQLLLSPPDSNGGSTSASGNPILSPFANATLPKPYTSNASAPEHFAGAPSTLLPSTWRDSTMAGLDRPGLSLFPPTLSPPQHFTTASSMNGYHHPRPIIERPLPHYHTTTTMGTGYIPRAQFPFSTPFNRLPPTDQSYHPGIPMPQPDPQRPEGPPFRETKVTYNPITGSGMSLRPDIIATISKGFFQVDGKWTCYRRNYFTVCCAFNFGKHTADGHLYLKQSHDKHSEYIQHFAVSISAKTAVANNQETEPRGLVQHTPKRNKESETVPSRHIVVPSPSPQLHQQNGAMSLGAGYHGAHPHSAYQYPNYPDPPSQSAPPSYTFERIQFQKATANNGKRRAQQQYFHVVVELFACLTRKHGGEEWILIATKESDPMVVRGRSPGHYKDNARRDSQASMDPDRGTGPGSDGSSGGHYGSYPPSSMDWQPTQQGGHHQPHHHQRYSGSGYHHSTHLGGSPPSATSSTTLTGSPTDLDFGLSDADTMKSSELYSLDRSRPITPSEATDDAFFNLGRALESRKRPLEDDSGDEEASFACSQPFSDTLSTHAFDLPSMAQPKVLCAS